MSDDPNAKQPELLPPSQNARDPAQQVQTPQQAMQLQPGTGQHLQAPGYLESGAERAINAARRLLQHGEEDVRMIARHLLRVLGRSETG